VDDKNNGKSRILTALKQRIQEATDRDIILDIVQSIGDRRCEDFQDILVTLDQTVGWNSTVNYLKKSLDAHYSYPIGIDAPKKKIEPIKYREVLFEVLGCKGLEPTNISTQDILGFLESKTSFTDSANSLLEYILPVLRDQITNHDTFFLDVTESSLIIPKEMHIQIEHIRKEELIGAAVLLDNQIVSVEGLWHSEYGLHALSKLDLTKLLIDEQEMEMVLSVIPVSDTIKNQIISKSAKAIHKIKNPHHPLYHNLLTSMIAGDISNLRDLGSRHAVSYFSILLECILDEYNADQTAEKFRLLVKHIDNLVSIRSLKSIILLQSIINTDNPRIVTPSISALGNFYHIASVETLIELICNKRNKEIVNAAIEAIENIHKRNPQFEYAIKDYLQLNCTNYAQLKKLYRKLAKKSNTEMYYK